MRRLACTSEDTEVGVVGVVGAQVEVEVWQDRAHNGVLEPSARDLVDERKVEDTLVPLK